MMSKKQVISLVTVGAMLLSGSAGVFADEVSETQNLPVVSEALTESESGTVPENGEVVDDGLSGVDTPIEEPIIPDIPAEEPKDETPKVDEQPIIPDVPEEAPSLPEPSTPSNTELPKEEPKDDKVSEVPTEEIPSTPETPKQDVEQPLKDKTKEPQADDSLFIKPIKEPTPAEPIFSQKGDKIIGTQDSQLLIQKSDGTIQTQSVNDLGGTVLSDGTVALKDSTGEVKRLPKTGDDVAGSFAMAISGVIALFGTAFVKAKKLLG